MLNTLINLIFNLRLKLRSISLSCACACLLFAPVISVAAEKPPISVIAYQVQRINQPQHIKALGNLQANQAIQISANVTENIQAIHFKDGQNVRKNQLLIELNNLEELALLAQADALTDEAKTQYQRVKDVLGRGSVTRSLVDEKQSIWQAAAANRKVIQAQLADRKIIAPFDGQLGFSALSVGALVTPATQIVSLDDNHVMKLNLFAAVDFLPVLNIGQTVKVNSAAFPALSFQGKISAISPRLEQNLRMIKIIALIENPDQLLKSNMMVEAQIDLPAKQQLIVPNTALLMLGDHQYIYRLKAKQDELYQAEKVEVQTGEIGETYTEITSGLNANDLVVSQGVMRVKSKASVHIKGFQNNLSQEQLLQPEVKSNQPLSKTDQDR
ncbi:MAG: efflux RND transporter periplasmic adaptor subunit [Spirochaetales bacterium]|nr:efflux RND transporter periplasmic adaptor subunit [Spirochaetales bacterium]